MEGLFLRPSRGHPSGKIRPFPGEAQTLTGAGIVPGPTRTAPDTTPDPLQEGSCGDRETKWRKE